MLMKSRRITPTRRLILQEGFALYKRLTPENGEIDAKNGLAVLKFLADELNDKKTTDGSTVVFVDDLNG